MGFESKTALHMSRYLFPLKSRQAVIGFFAGMLQYLYVCGVGPSRPQTHHHRPTGIPKGSTCWVSPETLKTAAGRGEESLSPLHLGHSPDSLDPNITHCIK